MDRRYQKRMRERHWLSQYLGGKMSDYKLVIVGTDGSDSSFRAVDEAAAIAAKANAKLIVATAYLRDEKPSSGEPDQPEGEGYKTQGAAPVYEMLREASDRARRAGVTDVEERPLVGAPVDVLLELAEEVKADLLVVGNVGVNSVAGRLLGSVPTAVKRRAKTEVLVVETTD
jgi:nucleotide-binding universal stress UspA family protein